MRFGNKILEESNNIYKDFYVDYSFIKELINDSNSSYDVFMKGIKIELKKVNNFVSLMKTKINIEIDLLQYCLINYMAVYKLFKKYDKKRHQNKKLDFFLFIQKQEFYIYFQSKRKVENIQLVIFDKDGTIIDNTLMFGEWAKKMIYKLAELFENLLLQSSDYPSIWEYLGYDPVNNLFSCDSVIAKGTNDDMRNAMCDYIVNVRKIVVCRDKEERKSLIDTLRKIWVEIEVTRDTIKECVNTRALFEFLKMKNIKIAICTSDDRVPTEKTLRLLNIAVADNKKRPYINNYTANMIQPVSRKSPFYIDKLVCGNDGLSSKPSPEPILSICKSLNIPPSKSLMVGDTIADVHAGINAKCSRVVGVLSGGYVDSNLNEADHVCGNIEGLIKIIMENEASYLYDTLEL